MGTFAQTVVMPWAMAFAAALLPIIGGFALAELRKHGVDTKWFEAIGRAGGAAYSSLLASGKPATDKAALASAALAGAAYLQDRVPTLIASKGLAPADVAQVAGAELGKLLGLDPTVTLGGVQSVTARAVPGQTAMAVVESTSAGDAAPIAKNLG